MIEVGVLWCPQCGAATVGHSETTVGEEHLPEWSEDDLGGLTKSIEELKNEIEGNREKVLEALAAIEENIEDIPSDRLIQIGRSVKTLRDLIGPPEQHPIDGEFDLDVEIEPDAIAVYEDRKSGLYRISDPIGRNEVLVCASRIRPIVKLLAVGNARDPQFVGNAVSRLRQAIGDGPSEDPATEPLNARGSRSGAQEEPLEPESGLGDALDRALDSGEFIGGRPSKCGHGNDPGDCDACDRLGDAAFDADREDRFFGGSGR